MITYFALRGEREEKDEKNGIIGSPGVLIAGTPTVPVMAANDGVETAGTVHAAESTEAQVQAFVERMDAEGRQPSGKFDETYCLTFRK